MPRTPAAHRTYPPTAAGLARALAALGPTAATVADTLAAGGFTGRPHSVEDGQRLQPGVAGGLGVAGGVVGVAEAAKVSAS